MLKTNPAALEFMATRRSRPAKMLTTPVPEREELIKLLTIAARCPDHGKLEPWRFIVLERQALARLAASVDAAGKRLNIEAEKIAKVKASYQDADLAVAVVSSPKPTEKFPEIEQILSAGALCSQLLNTCLAAGWGANWLTGWPVHDAHWRQENLGLAPHETIAGMVHIGTEKMAPPERPRPDINAITSWVAS